MIDIAELEAKALMYAEAGRAKPVMLSDVPEWASRAVTAGRNQNPSEGYLWWPETTSERRCALCGIPECISGRLVMDHCHVSGLERGYVCRSCNSTEPHGNDDFWRAWRLYAPRLSMQIPYCSR